MPVLAAVEVKAKVVKPPAFVMLWLVEKLLFMFLSATLELNLASATVPVEMLVPFSVVRPDPSPVKMLVPMLILPKVEEIDPAASVSYSCNVAVSAG